MPRLVMGLAHPPIHWMLGALSHGVEQLQLDANHLPPSGDEVKCDGSYASTVPVCLPGMCRDNFF
jgi:hypothetical protein